MARGYPSSINSGTIFMVVYVVFGLYFVNLYFKLVDLTKVIPASSLANITGVINVVGGILLILGGFNFLRLKKAHPYPPGRY